MSLIVSYNAKPVKTFPASHGRAGAAAATCLGRAAVVLVVLATGAVAVEPAADSLRAKSQQDPGSPERRALAFLAVEVPRWSRENHCYSCHNNGDAARALYAATRLGYPVSAESLQDTTAWLTAPLGWKDNGGDLEFGDPQLADLQFTSALRVAIEAGVVPAREPLRQATRLLVGHQAEDGSWRIDASAAIGSPATYGRALATVAAIQALRAAPDEVTRPARARAECWLWAQRPATVLDAAAVLLGLGPGDDSAAIAARRHCLQVIRRGEAAEGGWGPYVNSRTEPFDTALVVLALSNQPQDEEVKGWIARGRKVLVDSQLADGSWLETTRPAGAISYAQRLATCGWATLALLETVGAEEHKNR